MIVTNVTIDTSVDQELQIGDFKLTIEDGFVYNGAGHAIYFSERKTRPRDLAKTKVRQGKTFELVNVIILTDQHNRSTCLRSYQQVRNVDPEIESRFFSC